MTPSINQVAHLMDNQLRNTADDIEDDASVTFSDGSPYDTDSELEDVLGLQAC